MLKLVVRMMPGISRIRRSLTQILASLMLTATRWAGCMGGENRMMHREMNADSEDATFGAGMDVLR